MVALKGPWDDARVSVAAMQEPGIAFTSPQTPLIAAPIRYLDAHQEPPRVLCLEWSLCTEEKHTLFQHHCYSQAANGTLPTSFAPDYQRWIISSRIAGFLAICFYTLVRPEDLGWSIWKAVQQDQLPPHTGELTHAAIAFVKRSQFQALQEDNS